MRGLLLIAGIAALVAAAVGITYAQRPPQDQSPAAVYAELQTLQAQVASVNEEIGDLEHRFSRARKALRNQEMVAGRNAEIITRLQQWVDGE